MDEPYQKFVAKGEYISRTGRKSFNGMFRRFLDGKLVGAMKGGALALGTMSDEQMTFLKLGHNLTIYFLGQRPPNDYAGTTAILSPDKERAIWANSLPELKQTHGIRSLPEVLDILGRIEKSRIEAHLDRDSIELARKSINPAELTLLEVSAVRF